MHLVRYICACNLYEVKVTVCCHKHDPYPPFSTYHSHSIHVYSFSKFPLTICIWLYLNTLFPFTKTINWHHSFVSLSFFFLLFFTHEKAVVFHISHPNLFAEVTQNIFLGFILKCYLCVPKQALLKLMMLMTNSPFRSLCKV